jgi:hypothetical protein
MMKTPQGATHFRVITTGLELDFDNSKFIADTKSSADLLWNYDLMADTSLTVTVTPNSTKALFFLVGLEFNQFVNGKYYPIISGDFSALRVIKISAAA